MYYWNYNNNGRFERFEKRMKWGCLKRRSLKWGYAGRSQLPQDSIGGFPKKSVARPWINFWGHIHILRFGVVELQWRYSSVFLFLSVHLRRYYGCTWHCHTPVIAPVMLLRTFHTVIGSAMWFYGLHDKLQDMTLWPSRRPATYMENKSWSWNG